jgi:hypothetical protein
MQHTRPFMRLASPKQVSIFKLILIRSSVQPRVDNRRTRRQNDFNYIESVL